MEQGLQGGEMVEQGLQGVIMLPGEEDLSATGQNRRASTSRQRHSAWGAGVTVKQGLQGASKQAARHRSEGNKCCQANPVCTSSRQETICRAVKTVKQGLQGAQAPFGGQGNTAEKTSTVAGKPEAPAIFEGSQNRLGCRQGCSLSAVRAGYEQAQIALFISSPCCMQPLLFPGHLLHAQHALPCICDGRHSAWYWQQQICRHLSDGSCMC